MTGLNDYYVDAAISLGTTYAAHVDALAVRYIPTSTGLRCRFGRLYAVA